MVINDFFLFVEFALRIWSGPLRMSQQVKRNLNPDSHT